MLPYDIQWDSVASILFFAGLFYSPALITLTWSFITLQPRVRKLLLLTFLFMMTTWLLTGLTYGLWTGLCAEGHALQAFGQCAFGLGWLVDISVATIFMGGIIGGGLAVSYCIYLEILQFKRAN